MTTRRIERILCPVDFSAQADAALSYAASLAQKLGAALTVMHARRYVPYIESAMTQPESVVEESEKRKREAVQDLMDYTRKVFPNLQADFVVADRLPVEGIIEAVSETDADLIVMSTTGRSGFKRLVLGSVAEGVMQRTPVPVLSLRRDPERSVIDVDFRRILVPTAFGEPSVRALEAAACFAEIFHSHLTVAHVVERDGQNEEAARERVREWVSDKSPSGCELEVVARTGNAAEQIVRLAEETSADLIAVAAVYRPFLETTIAGTTSERVVRFAPCPVLTVPIHEQRRR